jgi:hypothetical protein
MLMGTNYIYIELDNKNIKSNIPKYLLENFDSNYINSTYMLPAYTMIKFRDKNRNIDESNNILKLILSSRDWNVYQFHIE